MVLGPCGLNVFPFPVFGLPDRLADFLEIRGVEIFIISFTFFIRAAAAEFFPGFLASASEQVNVFLTNLLASLLKDMSGNFFPGGTCLVGLMQVFAGFDELFDIRAVWLIRRSWAVIRRSFTIWAVIRRTWTIWAVIFLDLGGTISFWSAKRCEAKITECGELLTGEIGLTRGVTGSGEDLIVSETGFLESGEAFACLNELIFVEVI